MYVVEKPSWLKVVFLSHGHVLPAIWARIVFTVTVATLFTVLHQKVPWFHLSLTPAPFTLIGLPLGIFLGFRNNSSYDRFWEARKLWGALVNTSRSLTRQLLTLVDAAADVEAEVVAFRRMQAYRLVAFVHAFRAQLRDEDPFAALAGVLLPTEVDTLRPERNVPSAILHTMGEDLAGARRRGWVHPLHATVLEGSLTALTDIQGGCERIKATPIPFSYTVLIHRIVALYCVLLPFGLADSAGWTTPLVVLFVSYALFALDAVGDEIENPFGFDTNDLPLTAISRMIERDVRQRLGERALPELLKPVGGVLS